MGLVGGGAVAAKEGMGVQMGEESPGSQEQLWAVEGPCGGDS